MTIWSRALLADLRLRDAELVDAPLHDRDRAVEVVRRELVALRRNRLQDHLEAALEVEAESRLLVDRRPGDGEHDRADERRLRSRRSGSDTCAGRSRVRRRVAAGSVPASARPIRLVRRAPSAPLPPRAPRLPRLVMTPPIALRATRTSSSGAISHRTSSSLDAGDLAVDAAGGHDLVADLELAQHPLLLELAPLLRADQHEVEEGEGDDDDQESGAAHQVSSRVECVRSPALEGAALDRLPRRRDEIDQEAQIMQAEQPQAENLLLVDEVTDVRAGESRARRAGAARVERAADRGRSGRSGGSGVPPTSARCRCARCGSGARSRTCRRRARSPRSRPRGRRCP